MSRGQRLVVQREGISRLVSETIGASQLSDRFQGALLGFSLAPTALSFSRVMTSDSCLELLHQAIDVSQTQTKLFVSAPNTWTLDLTRLQNPELLLPACVPVLLRYHDSWKRRFDRLSLLLLQVDSPQLKGAAEDWYGSIARVLMLGDLLEAMSFDELQLASQLTWMAWLSHCAERYRIVPQLHLQYQVLSASIGMSANEVMDNENRASFGAGVASALACRESYVLAVGTAGAIAPSWMAAFVAGLLLGAMSGASGLPALCQLRLENDSPRMLASELFSLWTGGFSAASLPN